MMSERICREEAIKLWEERDLNLFSLNATHLREKINGNKVFYNRNFHIEPSNVCVHHCKFCSFRRDCDTDDGAWSMDIAQIREYCREKYHPGITEVHIVGSNHPVKEFSYYTSLIEAVREELPDEVTIKAFSAVEIDYMTKISGLPVKTVLSELKSRGVNALPGGGAEIFDERIRREICPDKTGWQRWIEIHKTAHELGIRSNATMLFGHIEDISHRVDHLLAIRELQDTTQGFDAFIPLVFKPSNNQLSHIKEAGYIDILKTFAMSRLVLHNIPHIKSYWPMLGRELCQLSLLFGADDIDGTINDSTKIYSMAGAGEKKPSMSEQDLQEIAMECGYIAVERDSYYNQVIKK